MYRQKSPHYTLPKTGLRSSGKSLTLAPRPKSHTIRSLRYRRDEKPFRSNESECHWGEGEPAAQGALVVPACELGLAAGVSEAVEGGEEQVLADGGAVAVVRDVAV